METGSIITYGCFHPDYTEEMKYFDENKVYTVQIESNLACQQGCRYCYASSGDDEVKELPGRDIIDILDSAARMEVRAIDWLGGDPLLRGDWYELMKYAMDKGLKNNIWTSGIPLENIETARKAVEVTEGGFISVHLDSLDEEIYGKLHTGSPEKKIKSILNGVKNLLDLGKEPDNIINCITFTRLAAGDDVKRTTRYFFENFGIRTCLTQMCRTGLAREHEEWIPLIQEIKEACEVRDEVNYATSRLSMSTMDANKFYCGGVICVTIEGDLTPCSVIRKGYGNIHDTSFEQAVAQYKDDLLLTDLRDPVNLPGYCSTCKNNPVCWGCRATAFYENGDILAEDPRCWMNPENQELMHLGTINKGKKLDFTIGDVNEVYEGPAGRLWEMLMGEQIHVGGESETDVLAQKAGVSSDSNVLDICSALGGPARHLAGKYGSRITGLDATQRMLDEAARRTADAGLDHLVDYRLGNGLDIPFKACTFDIVWGQDAWCYITDKQRLVEEAYRVLKPGGVIAFTDWIQTGTMTDEEWVQLNTFMVFPYMETLDGYEELLLGAGFNDIEKEDLSADFASHCISYQQKLRTELKNGIISTYGAEMFSAVDTGLDNWVRAAYEGKVGRGRLIARKL